MLSRTTQPLGLGTTLCWETQQSSRWVVLDETIVSKTLALIDVTQVEFGLMSLQISTNVFKMVKVGIPVIVFNFLSEFHRDTIPMYWLILTWTLLFTLSEIHCTATSINKFPVSITGSGVLFSSVLVVLNDGIIILFRYLHKQCIFNFN